MSATTIFKPDPSSSPLSPASSSSCSSSNPQPSEEIEMRSSFGEVDAHVAAASTAAIAYALELKPKVDLQPQPPLPPSLPPPTVTGPPQQKIKKLVRRNASDKLKLIRMVHDNPILWDSRLPNFKGAEEEKNRAWEMIGKEFNAPGRRVARAFKSLRESYRRELAHVKLMGNGFKPKWSLYDAMDFLRDVIRERKGGSHAADHNVTPLGLNLSAFAQHLNGAFNANTNNNTNSNGSSSNNNNKLNYKLSNDTYSEAALNLTKCAVAASSLNLNANASGNGNGDGSGGGGSGGDNYYYHFVKSELDLSQQHQQLLQHQQQNAGVNITQPQLQTPTINNNNSNNNNNNNSNSSVNHIPPAHQNSHNDSRVSSTRNDTTQSTNTTTTTTYVDDMDDISMRGSDETAPSMRHHLASTSHQESEEVEELEAIDADFPYPLILNSSQSPAINGGPHVIAHTAKRKRKHFNSNGRNGNNVNGSGAGGGGGGGGGNCGENEDDDDDDDDDAVDDVVGYGGQMLQQHRHLRGQNSIGMSAHAQALMAAGMDMLPPPQTVREVLNSKFCGFISAKLNSMEDSEADNLMNKILMLLVQTQTQNLTVQTHSSPSTSTSGSSTTTCNSNDNK